MAGWLAAAGALAAVAPGADPDVGESADLLPTDTPVHRTLADLARHFGDAAALSTVAVVVDRADGGALSPADVRVADGLAAVVAAAKATDPDLRAAAVRSPGQLAIVGDLNPLLSRDGRATLVTVGLPVNFITKSAGRAVRHVRAMAAAAPWPAGVRATVTGSAAFGYDYAIATERSHFKTSVVTLVSVVLILLAVYRAPLAAAVPLAGVSVAAAVAFEGLAVAGRWGLHGGTAEQIFTFVLLYGAGIDYAMLLMSRVRELRSGGAPWPDAVERGLAGSGGAILASASMTVCGLVTLCFARFSVFRFAGPAVVVALVVAALAAVSLVPAILAIVGPATFWPVGAGVAAAAAHPGGRVWPRVAEWVVKRPAIVLVAGGAVLCVPAARGAFVTWDYNSLASLRDTYDAPRGADIVARHWGPGEVGPTTLLVTSTTAQPRARWDALAARIVPAVLAVDGVADVRSSTTPLGSHVPAARTAGLRLFGGARIAVEYLSGDGQAMRLTVVPAAPPLSLSALATEGRVAGAAAAAVAADRFPGTVQAAGATAEMLDLRDITRADFHRTAWLTLAIILAVVTLVLWDPLLAGFIVGVTLLSYFAALGLTWWTFRPAAGAGLEWKVQMLLFVVLVAVGQDYSIFFAARFAQEARGRPVPDAVRRAVVATGPVISSCGLIMAATLGSIVFGDIAMLVQLGFAFAVGMLIDTFVVRPLLLPAFIVLTGRTLSRARLLRHG